MEPTRIRRLQADRDDTITAIRGDDVFFCCDMSAPTLCHAKWISHDNHGNWSAGPRRMNEFERHSQSDQESQRRISCPESAVVTGDRGGETQRLRLPVHIADVLAGLTPARIERLGLCFPDAVLVRLSRLAGAGGVCRQKRNQGTGTVYRDQRVRCVARRLVLIKAGKVHNRRVSHASRIARVTRHDALGRWMLIDRHERCGGWYAI